MKKIFSLLVVSIFLSGIFAVSNSSANNNDSLKVKSVNKRDFVRLFFFYEQPVGFTPTVDGKYLKVTFSKPFSFNPAQIQKNLGNSLTFATASDDGKTFLFKLNNDDYGYRKFIGEKFVGVDLIKRSNFANKKPAAKKRYIAKKNTPEITPTPKARPKLAIIQEEQDPPALPKINIAKAEKPLPELIQQFEKTSISDAYAPKRLAALGEGINKEVTETEEEKLPELFSEEEKNLQTEEQTPEINNIQDIEDLYAEKKAETSEIKKREFTSRTNITFPWEEKTGASVFTRGDYLWVVFDKYQKVNLKDIMEDNSIFFNEAEQITNKYYTILRFNTKADINVVSYKEDNNWIVAITEKSVNVDNEPEINVEVSELLGSKVLISSQNDMRPIRLIDPSVGDEMVILPYFEENTGFNTPRQYIDFTFIKTAQGVSIQLISDGIELETLRGKVGIAGPTNKLAGSAQASLRELQEREREAKLLAERLKQKGGELTLLQFNNWRIGNDASFKKDLEGLQWKITEVNWSEKSVHRLNLARFYMAHRLYAEALGVIRIIREYDEEFSNSNDVKMVEAAAFYLFGKHTNALDILTSIDKAQLKNWEKEEVKFWQTASNLQITSKIQVDDFLSENPLNQDKKDEEELLEENEVENTRLMWDTSSRLLKIIRKMDPDFVNSEEIQKLESTARFVTNHYHEAIKRFEESDLYRTGDIFEAEENKLWWSTTNERASDNDSLRFVENIDSFLKYYPNTIYNDLAMLALEDRLKRNDLVVSEELISLLKEEERFQEQNSIAFLKGLFHAKDEEGQKAIEIWEEIAKNPMDRYNRVRAQFALTVFLLKNKEIELAEAIEQLNSIRSTWRGGTVEFHVLKLLGEFYMEQKNYMEGFRVWRNTIAAFPGSDESLLIAKKMSEKFVQVFSQGEADDMPKLDALTLYYEFRELTPIGKLGDEMISRLADRLIEVDLLKRAAALLTHQVRFRLIGEEKQAAVIKLVNVHLMNLQPQDALDVLNATYNENIAPQFALKRKYLKARCLIEIGKSNRALALLKGDESHKASFLRAEVYWRNKVWRKVVEELETPFREIRREAKNLNKDETEQILRLSVAYALTERKKRLQVLYEDFIGFMNDEERKKIFKFVAIDRGPVDFRNLDHTVELNSIKSFLGKYIETNANTNLTDEPA